MNSFFITGMFRSGTTLISRMFQSHPEIACASDPYAPLFKEFRNQYISNNLKDFVLDLESPHDDYYYYDSKISFFHELQATSFDMSCENVDWAALLDKMANSSKPYSPLLFPYYNKLPGSTFKETLVNGIDLIRQTYGDDKTKLVGFKEVWTNEFGIHIVRDVPNFKVVHIIRDPRAVCASNLVTSTPYPMIFLLRQWRKACASALYQKKFSKHGKNVFILRYEDLISQPDIYIKKVCDFLKIEPHKNMYNPSTYLDGNNQQWLQNSSHRDPILGFNVGSINKWKEVLSDRQISMIESMCCGEMSLFEYETAQNKFSLSDDIIFNPPEVKQADIANWLRPFVDQSEQSLVKELSLERVRLNALICDKNIDKKIAVKLGLWDEIFQMLRENLKRNCL
jgi:hypothetical protein